MWSFSAWKMFGKKLANSPSTYWIRFFPEPLRRSVSGQSWCHWQASWNQVPGAKSLHSGHCHLSSPFLYDPWRYTYLPNREWKPAEARGEACILKVRSSSGLFLPPSPLFKSCLCTRLIRKNFILLQQLFFKWPHENLLQCQNKQYILMISIPTEI